MKRYCAKCFKSLKKDEDVCHHCGEDNSSSVFASEDISEKKRAYYKGMRKAKDTFNRAMSLEVIGAICLILGGVLLYLSFKYDSLKIRHFTPGSTEFICSVILLAAAIVLLTLGTIWLVSSHNQNKFWTEFEKEEGLKAKKQ